MLLAAMVAAGGLLVGCFAGAQQFGTATEAKAMFDRAIAALKTDEKAALAAFNDKNNKEFHHNDLYVFCFNAIDGRITAHPNPALIDTDSRALKFKDDAFGLRAFNAVKEGTVTTIDYNFPKPGTVDPVPKQSFLERVGSMGCGVGYYK